MGSKLTGIFPALYTLFDAEDHINKSAMKALIDYDIDGGAGGFYVGGSTGEAFLMSVDERVELIELCAELNDGRVPLIAQVGDISERTAVTLAKAAAGCGYTAVSAVVPFYYGFSFAGIKDYYAAIADAAQRDLYLYYIPGKSGVSYTAEQLAQLMAIPGVAGIKYTSNDLFMFERIKTAYPDKNFFFGFDEMLTAGLSFGADGAIGSTYNFLPHIAVGVYKAMQKGDLAEAARYQRIINTTVEKLMSVGFFEGSKALMQLLGIDAGRCRRPFGVADAEAVAMLRCDVLPLIAR